MTVIHMNYKIILPSASERENRVMVSILENLKSSFQVAQDQGKLREFLQECALGILTINQRAGLLHSVESEKDYVAGEFNCD